MEIILIKTNCFYPPSDRGDHLVHMKSISMPRTQGVIGRTARLKHIKFTET